MHFFGKHEIINRHQCGFQQGKCIENAVLNLLYNTISALEKKGKAALSS